MSRLVLILSGGMDSATLLWKAVEDGYREIFAMSFNYGQRHVKELECAKKLCELCPEVVSHKIFPLDILKQFNPQSSLTSDVAVPEGHYTHPSMTKTVVGNRNMLMLTLAHTYALALGADAIAYGCHNGDAAIYPDCRPAFVDSMKQTLFLSNDGAFDKIPTLYTPFLDTDKTGILTEGLRLGVPYEHTWTCYNGREKACGKCGSCQERLEAFTLNNVQDPVPYESEA